jgi:DNA mismatch endonuclease, patch repair protein
MSQAVKKKKTSLADPPPSAVRSANMAKVKGKNTSPEMLVRKTVHAMGYRYRLHARELPGTPDLVFPWRRKIIFVHGCFWHRHLYCKRASMPSTRKDYWQTKLSKNVARDAEVIAKLEASGWDVLVLWECALRDRLKLESRLSTFLDSPHAIGAPKAD